MQINGANNEQIDIILEGLLPAKPGSNKTSKTTGADAHLTGEYSSLINKALEQTDSGADDIQRAQQIIASGQLDSFSACFQAAENIVRFGI